MALFINILGWFGAVLVVLAYYMLVTKHVKVNSYTYELMNFFGAVFVGANVFYLSAWPSLFIQVVWGIIAILGLYKLIFKK
jgi:hypothetical protein